MRKQRIEEIVVIVAVIVGYVVGASFNGGLLSGRNAANQAKLDEFKKMFPTMPDSNSIYGTVNSINGDIITLDTPNPNPFDESPKARQVTVASSTKIVKRENKPMVTMQKEQEVFFKKMSSWRSDVSNTSTTLPESPSPFIEKKISVSDIKVGDQISVEAVSQIRMFEKFEATKISVQGPGAIMVPPSAGVAPASAPAPAPAPAPASASAPASAPAPAPAPESAPINP